MRKLPVLVALLSAWSALALGNASRVPKKHIPSSVLAELHGLEGQFEQALAHDCAPERCVSKGCVYRDHAVVDEPASTSLPGIDQDQGVGSVPPQEYLTRAECDFAYEKSVSPQDVEALTHRLEERLSMGWLRVSVGRQALEPLSPALRETPSLAQPPAPAVTKAEPAAAPATWNAGTALRELWETLLPHFSWMIALVLVTFAALLIIWALRRLGRESLEEKALLARLTGEGAAKATDATASVPTEPGPAGSPTEEERAAAAFVGQQQQAWTERFAQTELSEGAGGGELLNEWLRTREFDLLAKAILVFGDQLSLAFSSDGELAVRKVEFADYLKHLDEQTLPSDAAFFRALNHQAISTSLLSQSDADLYRSLGEEFGSAGVAHLIEALPQRFGALLFAFAPAEGQDEVARSLSPELRRGLVDQLLASNRISNDERKYLFEVLAQARAGQPLPPAPRPGANEIVDRGRELDSAGALSVLLPHLEAEDRRALFTRALQRASGAFPRWYENILYPDMLLRLPDEVRSDLLLEVDVKELAGWSSVQHPVWQEGFLAQLAPSMQSAVRANMGFASRAEQLRMARRGQQGLVSAVKRGVARGRISFPELVA